MFSIDFKRSGVLRKDLYLYGEKPNFHLESVKIWNSKADDEQDRLGWSIIPKGMEINIFTSWKDKRKRKNVFSNGPAFAINCNLTQLHIEEQLQSFTIYITIKSSTIYLQRALLMFSLQWPIKSYFFHPNNILSEFQI